MFVYSVYIYNESEVLKEDSSAPLMMFIFITIIIFKCEECKEGT